MEDISVTSVKRRAESSQEGGAGKEMIYTLVCLVVIADVYNLEIAFCLYPNAESNVSVDTMLLGCFEHK